MGINCPHTQPYISYSEALTLSCVTPQIWDMLLLFPYKPRVDLWRIYRHTVTFLCFVILTRKTANLVIAHNRVLVLTQGSCGHSLKSGFWLQRWCLYKLPLKQHQRCLAQEWSGDCQIRCLPIWSSTVTPQLSESERGLPQQPQHTQGVHRQVCQR